MEEFEKLIALTKEVGYVTGLQQGIVQIEGLPGAHSTEMLMFESGQNGIVFELEKERIKALVLENSSIVPQTRVARMGRYLSIEVSDDLLGKVITPIGKPLNAKRIKKGEPRLVDTLPVGMASREDIKETLPTGVAVVDIMIPIARGQRELVVGDRKTGKTQFLKQAALNTAIEGQVCIYASIAKGASDTAELINFFRDRKALENMVFVTSSSADASSMIYLTPFTAMTIAEYFRDKGKDVLIILDDLTAHAQYYRAISLLARRFPGRSSYPGDIFHLHSRLLERAGNFKKGSISALPVAETIMSDISGYISTNLMSITDGHIYFDIDLHNKGVRPPVNVFYSVTRVGRQAQSPLMREINSKLTSFMHEQTSLRDFLHFGAEISDELRQRLDLGERLQELFEQQENSLIPINISTMLVGCLWASYWKNVETSKVRTDMNELISTYQSNVDYQKQVDLYISKSQNFDQLINFAREYEDYLLSPIK